MDPLTGKIQVMNQIALERQFTLKVEGLQSVNRKIKECVGLRWWRKQGSTPRYPLQNYSKLKKKWILPKLVISFLAGLIKSLAVIKMPKMPLNPSFHRRIQLLRKFERIKSEARLKRRRDWSLLPNRRRSSKLRRRNGARSFKSASRSSRRKGRSERRRKIARGARRLRWGRHSDKKRKMRSLKLPDHHENFLFL